MGGIYGLSDRAEEEASDYDPGGRVHYRSKLDSYTSRACDDVSKD